MVLVLLCVCVCVGRVWPWVSGTTSHMIPLCNENAQNSKLSPWPRWPRWPPSSRDLKKH